MKSVYLMRHSIPEKSDLPTELIPLSDDGRKLVMARKEFFSGIDKCFSSPYKRALETAQILSDHVIVQDNLHERLIGITHEDFWLKQYLDYDFHNPGGESLNMVKVRMKQAMDMILNDLNEGEKALVVSHATAICSYLLNDCTLEVSDPSSKSRIITFRGQEVLHGKIEPTDCFEIEYVNNSIENIYFHISKQEKQ